MEKTKTFCVTSYFQMNLPANPPQMNPGLRDPQAMNQRMPGHLLNQQPMQQQLQNRLQQPGNPNLMGQKPMGMNQAQQQMPGHQGPMSVASSLQQGSVAGGKGRSGAEMGLSSVQSSIASSTAMSQAHTQLVGGLFNRESIKNYYTFRRIFIFG